MKKTKNYTELLLSLSVIDQDGVVYHLIHDIPEDDFNIERGGQVEIIGWLYQYYNTEPKAAALAKNGKITKGGNPCCNEALHPGLDRPLHGGEQPWPSVGGRTPGMWPERKLEASLSGGSTTGAGGAGKAG